jgi:hypothetical protein
VNCAGPRHDDGASQTVKPRFTVVALVDFEAKDGTAVSLRGQRVELARATVSAVAMNEFASHKCPFGISHFFLPRSMPDALEYLLLPSPIRRSNLSFVQLLAIMLAWPGRQYGSRTVGIVVCEL